MPCWNVFFYTPLAFLSSVSCDHRCQTSSLNVLDVTNVAETQARLRRTWKRIKTWAKVWVDAEVGSKACQVQEHAEAQNGNCIETHCMGKPGNWNFENQPLACPLLLQIPPASDCLAKLVGRNNIHLIPTLLWLLHGLPILISTKNHLNFKSLISNTSNRWMRFSCLG